MSAATRPSNASEIQVDETEGKVYCPGCGSNNQDGLKFCTRCGTNLGVVSDALSGRPADKSEIDERLVKLFKDYYRGRNSIIIGGVASLIALFKAVLFALIGLPARTDFLATLAAMLLLYGIISLLWGLAKWNNSVSEIRALGFEPPKGMKVSAAPEQLRLPTD